MEEEEQADNGVMQLEVLGRCARRVFEMINGGLELADVADLSFIAAGLSHFEGLGLQGKDRLVVIVHRRARPLSMPAKLKPVRRLLSGQKLLRLGVLLLPSGGSRTICRSLRALFWTRRATSLWTHRLVLLPELKNGA